VPIQRIFICVLTRLENDSIITASENIRSWADGPEPTPKEPNVVKNFASSEETLCRSRTYPDIAFRPLGNTGLWASQAGFGGYRITSGITEHRNALEKALTGGINLIDTSANYADGKSELLIGQVLTDLIDSGHLSREQLIVVSKVGYLQGQNYEFSQQRKAQGKPFHELVDFGEGLAHCIHPEFLEDQLKRSLERLNLETLDFYLLHNPEYYLDWAAKSGISLPVARREYYHRIQGAFEFMEQMVEKGRIRYYGVSSNTFPAAAAHEEFTCLETLWNSAQSLSENHHFRLIQLPLNLLETGAVLEKNQSEEKSVLDLASTLELAVLINRPLNAFDGERLLRLANVPIAERLSTDEIIDLIRAVSRSEKSFQQRLLPKLDLAIPLQNRVTEQLAIGEMLTHHWRHFGSYERWLDIKNGHLLARVRGVEDFLKPYQETVKGLSTWIKTHMQCVEAGLKAVESTYSEAAGVETRRIARAASASDPDWANAETLSQQAVRAVRSTAGVSSVLVGMRQEEYVTDILAELKRPIIQQPRTHSWQKLKEAHTALKIL